MERKKFFVANWKMHKSHVEAAAFIDEAKGHGCEMWIAPPFTALPATIEAAKGSSISIGAQNISHQSGGAFTGEVAAEMVAALGATFTIIGHSERRALYHETHAEIAGKLQRALENNLRPILCIGESAREREAGETHKVLQEQLCGALEGIAIADVEKLIVAYEPVWAIGTGISATPDMAQETHFEVRRIIGEIFTPEIAQATPILYGGSVKPENSRELMSEPDIDGALIGGASLKVDSYLNIIKQGTQS